MNNAPKVYQALSNVQADIAALGIAKGRKNAQQGYAFRGIDDIYNTLAPIFAKHKLIIIPEVLSREQAERVSVKGTPLFYTTCRVKYTFISAEDGSKDYATVDGEAMDSADKSTNKAMSAAYKYMCLQTFSIPTEGDNDADATTHEVAPRQPAKKPQKAHPAADKNIIEKINEAKTVRELTNIYNDIVNDAGDAREDVYAMYAASFAARKQAILRGTK